ncbi:32985_t:CDS:2, partial [Racocetra persica]
MSTSIPSNEILRNFLKNEPLEQLSISRIIHELWRVFGMETVKLDCERIINMLEDMLDKDISGDRKSHLQELKNIDKIRFSWNELKTLKDADLFCNKFEEQTDWKVEAECTIGNIKDKLE